jgi:diacylglycerol kinase (ATP)
MNPKEPTSAETVLIVNPNSCGGSTGKNWENLYNQIKEIFGENPMVAFSQKSGDGTTLTRDFLRRGFKKIVALGGDGTINEVANGFFEEQRGGTQTSAITDTADKNNGSKNTEPFPVVKPINPEAMLGLIPSGSRNVLAKSLDLPEGIVEGCKRFINAKPRKIDVISALITKAPSESTNDNPKDVTTRIFLNAAEIGVGAEIIDRSKKVREKIKSRIVSTITSVIATLPTYESNLCDISIDDGRQTLISKMTMGIVANGKYLGGGFRAAPQASVYDGLLDITILKNSGSFKMLDGFANMKGDTDHTKKESNDIFYTQAKKVAVKSKERNITVTMDGEPIGILPAIFEVYQNALTVKF